MKSQIEQCTRGLSGSVKLVVVAGWDFLLQKKLQRHLHFAFHLRPRMSHWADHEFYRLIKRKQLKESKKSRGGNMTAHMQPSHWMGQITFPQFPLFLILYKLKQHQCATTQAYMETHLFKLQSNSMCVYLASFPCQMD